MNIFINQFFSTVSNYQISESIYLGKLLHFFIPMMITLILVKKGIKINQILSLIFFIGLAKEIYDLTTININLWNSLRDIFLDLSYPLFYMIIVALKKKLDSVEKKQNLTPTTSLYLKSENAYLSNQSRNTKCINS